MVRVGSRVMFSRRFLQSVGGHELANERGIVVQVLGDGPTLRAVVAWNGQASTSRALVRNLAEVGKVELD